MAFVKVGSASALSPGSVMEASLGEDYYAICNVAGHIHALAGTCPHSGGPLGQGALNGANLACPWHAWEFDCQTGAHDFNPAVRVQTFAVQVVGDDILVDLP
jgi:nitrite reductase/ring-hydroxylating ferredoxin subunit